MIVKITKEIKKAFSKKRESLTLISGSGGWLL